MPCIRPAWAKLLPPQRALLAPMSGMFLLKDKRPQKANSLIPDRSRQTVWDTT